MCKARTERRARTRGSIESGKLKEEEEEEKEEEDDDDDEEEEDDDEEEVKRKRTLQDDVIFPFSFCSLFLLSLQDDHRFINEKRLFPASLSGP